MNNAKKDWAFILLCLGLVMLISFLLSSCSVKCERNLCCPMPGHGSVCPICETPIPEADE